MNMSPWPYRTVLTENANELRTVQFAPYHQQIEHGGYLVRYGSRLKTETENDVFSLGFGKRFSLKNGSGAARKLLS